MSTAALAVLAALAVATPPTPPAPARWVEDHASFLSPNVRSALDQRLEGYERATGHQVVVWIGTTLEGGDLADWAVRTFASWKVGRKGFDDGIAMFVFATDRTIDIEVGYGLEDKIPDAIASRIIREVMAPRLRAGDRDGAVTAGADAVLAAIEGQPWAGGQGAGSAPSEPPPPLITLILGGLAAVAFLIFAITHPRKALWLLAWLLRTGGRGGLGGFGGSSGGFGGGGGRSGGGGARGSW
ncbi:MAG: hypothetical protein H6Q90_5102 [Deltaproteobacteria bacterium]|nr:hypothetical protein [Deltaproteobacteria bacterium]